LVGVGEVGGFAQSKMADLQMGKMDNLPADKLRPAGQESCELANGGGTSKTEILRVGRAAGRQIVGFWADASGADNFCRLRTAFRPDQNNLQVGI
jgi:SLT domain-containing protein